MCERGAGDQRRQQHGPVGEGLARQVRQDDLGGHAAKDERHCEAEEDEVVLLLLAPMGRAKKSVFAVQSACRSQGVSVVDDANAGAAGIATTANAAQQRRVGRVQPGANGERVDEHGRPLEKDGQHGQAARAPRAHDVGDAEGYVREHERTNQDADPYVARAVASENACEDVGSRSCCCSTAAVVAAATDTKNVGQTARPDVWSVVAGQQHDGARQNQAL